MPLRELGYSGQRKKTRRCCSFCSFCMKREKKYLFTNIDSFCPVWINMLFVKSLFFFPPLYVHSPSQADTLHIALNVPHLGEKKDQNTLNGLFVSSVSVKMWQCWSPVHGGELTVCGTSVCDPEAEFYRFCHVASRQSCEPEHTNIQSLCPSKKSTYFNTGCVWVRRNDLFLILFLYPFCT